MPTLTLNLTQHAATTEQLAAGVVDLPADERAQLVAALTFDAVPTTDEILARARALAKLASAWRRAVPMGDRHQRASAMIGGAPWLMAPLARRLRDVHVAAVFAFSLRVSADEPQPDGSVRKTAVFRHIAFVAAV